MNEPDIEKLRRFSLVVALIILTYSLAGITLLPDVNVSIVGLTFKVSRPSLLPIGLVVASLYALVRFYYYGFMLKKSPYRVRRNILDNLYCNDRSYRRGKKVPTYTGGKEFEAHFQSSGRESAEKYISDFPDAFPKFARARPSMKIKSDEGFTEDGESYTWYSVEVSIPVRCRIIAVIQDIDYAMPIWLNLVSLIIFSFQIGLKV